MALLRASLSTSIALILLALVALWLAFARPIDWAAFAVAAVVMSLLIVLGVSAAAQFGKGAPFLHRLFDGAGEVNFEMRSILRSIALGAGVGAVLLVVVVYVLAPMEPAIGLRLHARATDPFWRPLALSVESASLEELVFRLFIVSVVVWLFSAGWRSSPANAPAINSGVLIAAFVFALAHLPPWLAAVQPATPMLIVSVVGLNGFAGLVFGWIYWRSGIEAAIAAHFAADLVVQGIGPSLV